MPTLIPFICKDCVHKFNDLPEGVDMLTGNVNPGTGVLEGEKAPRHQCPDCDSTNVQPVQRKK